MIFRNYTVFLIKLLVINTAELKLKLFREIDTLDKYKLEEFYGFLLNFLNKNNTDDEWNSLTTAKKNGLLEAINEMNISEGVANDSILKKYTDKYA